jgi:iron complex outermembrane recepter protein
MRYTSILARSCASATAITIAMLASLPAHAQQPAATAADDTVLEDIVVTGSRIPRQDLEGTSPVAVTSQEQIALDRALNIEDFSVKLPQLAGGVNSTAAGSDAYGAQTLDLRGLGQNRTLVLINGTRATPFSFRNAVDVNAIPAPLLKQVDVLTGGAAAVYGADAVAGVVNFIINDEFDGIRASGNYEFAEDGGSQYGVNLAFGGKIGDRGHVVGYIEYAQREALLAGDRSWALPNSIPVANSGGNFTDVASGRIFSVNSAGAFGTTHPTTDFTPQFILIQPMKRWNASTFFKYDLLDQVELYGRVMYSNVRTTGASRGGSQPVVINEVVGINASNPNIPVEARPLLTFVNGVAQVRVNRSLGELGIITADTKRDTFQTQIGLRGDITDAIRWDTYFQFGRVSERTAVNGDGIARNPDGTSRFAGIANSADIFGPDATGGIAGLGSKVNRDIRERDQYTAAVSVAGDSSDMFSLPAGPIGFALGYEYRKEKGSISQDAALTNGLTFRQGTELPFKGGYHTNEVYGELLVPVLADLPFVKKLDLEGAYRISDYSNAGSFDTNKVGVNWEVNDSLRLRGTRQSVIRAPNIGEFAGPISSIPFNSLVNVARLRPRYQGDPCALGTGDAQQCQRLGYRGAYNSLDPNNLRGGYFFGGNPDIKPEKGTTYTLGAVFTPDFFEGFSLTVDYYDITLRDAVGQIQPVDALTSCYITDPRADNPLCLAVTRDPTTGFILNGFPVDRNLAVIKQRGIDIGARYKFDLPESMPGNDVTIAYQGTIVTDYSIQRNAVLAPIDCKGTYGFRCSSDAVSLVQADYRHRMSVTWASDLVTAQVGWQRIGSIKDSALGSTGRISPYNYFDLAFSVTPTEWASINVGVDNLFNKKPPLPVNPGSFNTYPDTYNVIGRTVGISLTIRQ